MTTLPIAMHHRGDRGSSLRSAIRSMHATRGRARQFARVFNKSLVPMMIVDNQRRYTDANAAARLIFRMSIAEFRTRRIDDLTPPHMAARLAERWERLMRDGSAAGSYDIKFLDGSELTAVYGALANVLPGKHLIVFAPAEWPEDEIVAPEDEEVAAPDGPLTPREREVLTLVAAGADLAQIADELTISVTTVRTHHRNALQKLGARNRAHAIAMAMRHGLIDLPPEPSGS
jgi:DNA-binding CsgD family transcriptional regulator